MKIIIHTLAITILILGIFSLIGRTQHLGNIGTTTVTSCGTTPTIVGDNTHGVITVGTGAVTACTLNFSHTLSVVPGCVFTPSGLVTVSVVPTTSVVAISFSLTLGGGKVSYWCFDPTARF